MTFHQRRIAFTAKLSVSWSINGFALLRNEKIVYSNRLGVALRSPLLAGVLEVPHQFLLLGVDLNRGARLLLVPPDLVVDVAELSITIRVGGSLLCLLIRLQAVTKLVQNLCDKSMADGMSHRHQPRFQPPHTLGCPTQRRVRVARGGWLDQRLRVGQQAHILVDGPLAAAAAPASAARIDGLSCLKLPHTALNRGTRNPGCRRDRSVTTGASAVYFACKVSRFMPQATATATASQAAISLQTPRDIAA